jgi:aspartate/methionine/tyrosine aminotransferase
MRLSNRLPDSFDPNPLALLLGRMKMASAPIFDLTASNPTVCGFDYPEDYILGAFGCRRALRYDPDPKGLGRARAAIAEMHGHGLGPDRIQLASSTSEAYGMLFKLLADPGDSVVAPTPSYPLFEWLARLEGLECIKVPAVRHEGWALDLDAVEGACGPRTRAVLVVNPNNPTGQFLTRPEWSGLVALAAKRGLPLIVDEVFSRYAIEPQADALGTILDGPDGPAPEVPVFLLSGISKAALLPQVKVGWIAMLGPAAGAGEALAFIADQYLSVSAPAAHATPRLLEIAPRLQEMATGRVKENLAALDGALKGHAHLGRCPVFGGWGALIRRPDVEDDEACATRLLADHRVLAYPGSFFDIQKNGYLAISLLPEPSAFRAAARALVDGLSLPHLLADDPQLARHGGDVRL